MNIEWGKPKMPNSKDWSSNDEVRRIYRELSLKPKHGSLDPHTAAAGPSPKTRAESIRTPVRRNPRKPERGFAETMAARERADEVRLWSWRIALERQTEPVN